ncbi:cyclic pyranopterin monophosphate synthase MoaC [Natronosalvus halobius]|uniref:cyclic pyranopterin monophosphate synthase MoaC n=1 Tax=Natronosalvus halobius TaxID=2953746 RepID=UPI00209D8989|nr:cyclic pyranopterin monophosphate synthase MoaC [Natronosalvus halobius]USZ71517.1 cyclic pyranopterin monophosphate synthase MoaC [Natronosalvus halobius]
MSEDRSNTVDADQHESTASDLTHTTDDGDVQMVDVGAKPDTRRRAVAVGEIRLRESTLEAIRADEVGKGDVLATARVGAIQAVKHTWETIPMCHQIPITNVDTAFRFLQDGADESAGSPGEDSVDEGDGPTDDETVSGRLELEVAVETTGKTGCEMEALEGVTTGLNVVWDMVKAVEKDEHGQYPATRIEHVRVLEKEKRSSDIE